MTKPELFKYLSTDQKEEFERDINSAIDNIAASKQIQMGMCSSVKIHLRLENKIFLHVRLTIDKNGVAHRNDLKITRFKNVDQFLDSLIEVRKNRSN